MALRASWVRNPETLVVRTVTFLGGREDASVQTHTMRMQQRLGTPVEREQYGQRFASVEPAFAILHYKKQVDRFALRGRAKKNGHWSLSSLVHNNK